MIATVTVFSISMPLILLTGFCIGTAIEYFNNKRYNWFGVYIATAASALVIYITLIVKVFISGGFK